MLVHADVHAGAFQEHAGGGKASDRVALPAHAPVCRASNRHDTAPGAQGSTTAADTMHPDQLDEGYQWFKQFIGHDELSHSHIGVDQIEGEAA